MERLLKRLDPSEPCRSARERDVPCFPQLVEAEAPEYSVEQSLREYVPDSAPSPSRPPTLSEMAPHRPGPTGPVVTFGSFDPTCAAKTVLKKLKGKPDTYYLYRIEDASGVRPLLTERPLDPGRHPAPRYTLVGRFEGECAAIAAYRRIERGIPERKDARRRDDPSPR